MNCDYDSDDLSFRDEVRAFLDEKLTPDLRRAGRLMTSVYADGETMRHWQFILHAKGWVAPAWPVEYGGCGWSPVRRYIFSTELASADAPALSPMGLSMCGPVLIGHGSDAQKSFYLPRILSGEDFWCQGYSEPAAGSDLAALQMRAEDAGDHWICNGQKIWTTHGMLANRIFCLVRTANEGAQQRGITFVLIDMKSPGIEVRPITMLSGEQIQCEIFFRDVAVPKQNVVGREGDGWTVAKYLLQFERGGNAAAPGLRARLNRVRDLARACGLERDADTAAKIAQTEIEIAALEFTEHRVMAAASHGAPSGVNASMLKIRSTEISQRVTEVALEVAGLYAVPFQPDETFPGGRVYEGDVADTGPIGPTGVAPVAARYLNERAGSIYAGSNEIQRNIIAKAGLAL
jgi:alkylation response protein AidB-like acyl-CoA dehydrogenase